MALYYRGELIHIVAHGTITLPDVLGLADKLASLEADLPVAPNRVMDLAGSFDTTIEPDAIPARALARYQAAVKNPLRFAVIAPSHQNVGVARMFEVLVANPQVEFRTFREAVEAWAWASRAPVDPGEAGSG